MADQGYDESRHQGTERTAPEGARCTCTALPGYPDAARCLDVRCPEHGLES